MTADATTRAPMRFLALVLASFLAISFAACGGDGDSNDTAADTQETPAEDQAAGGEITVTATEYAFNIPATLPAGETTFTLDNTGKEPHFLLMALFTEDAPPMEELLKMSEKESNKFIDDEVGMTKTVKPGESAKPFTVDLESGRTYGYVCFVTTKQSKKPHALLGMSGTFTVE